MNQSSRNFLKKLVLAVAVTGVIGCASVSDTETKSTPSPSLTFLDVQKFDRDLAASLDAGIERVEVSFYDPVSPNALPERLQKWVAATQAQGGRFTVEPPPGEPRPKSPMALISLLSSAFSGAKGLLAIQQDRALASAKKRDMVLMLERDAKTQKVQVAKLVFVKASP